MKNKQINKLTFEQALLELEKILNDVEKTNLNLEELVNSFEKGTELSNYCLNKLDEAKIKISTINKDDK